MANGLADLFIAVAVRVVRMIERLQLVPELQFGIQTAQFFGIWIAQFQVCKGQAHVQITDNTGQLMINGNTIDIVFNILANATFNFVDIF